MVLFLVDMRRLLIVMLFFVNVNGLVNLMLVHFFDHRRLVMNMYRLHNCMHVLLFFHLYWNMDFDVSMFAVVSSTNEVFRESGIEIIQVP